MTAPLRGTPRPSAIPPSQNTAPVAEFRCLFTHDVRRKQKRWQDGYLKLHTFNSRVMVYDTSRNFLGDTYWKESSELQEGDELTLDKGVMVEVADAIGVTQTDLTPLFEKKTKESPQRDQAAPAQRPLPKSVPPANNALRTGSQLRHKSLNTLLGTPKGPIGKSVPLQSPFEARKDKENEHTEERANKRQKTVHDPVVPMTSSPTREAEPLKNKRPPLWARTSDAKSARVPPRPIPREATVITLDSEPDNCHSDVTLPSPPPGATKLKASPKVPSPPARNPVAARQPPAPITPKLPRGKVPVPKVKAKETPRPPPRPSSPPVSASNRLMNIDFAIQPIRDVPQEPLPPKSPPHNSKMKALRLSAGVKKRGMLLCQSLPRHRADAASGAEASSWSKQIRSRGSSREDSAPLLQDGGEFILEHQKTNSTSKTKAKKKTEARSALLADNLEVPRVLEPSPEPSFDGFEDMEVIHGLMDQRLIINPSPPKPPETASKPRPAPKAAAARKKPEAAKETSNKEVTIHENPSLVDPAPKAKKGKTAATRETTDRPNSKKATAKRQPASRASPEPLPEPSEGPSKATPRPPPDACTDRFQDPSTIAAPNKVAPSTGGIRRKKAKSAQPAASKPNAPPYRAETVALPPHPLRANKFGPLMNATELSNLLQKTPKPARLEDDPIQDGTQGDSNISPNRSFKRSRSENDAPIPSTSDEWEKRNLRKAPSSKIDADPTTSEQEPEQVKKAKPSALSSLVKRTDPRRKFQRTQSLNVDMRLPAVEVEVVTPPPDDDVGPWSTEAFDLFDWRPPGRERDGDAGTGMLIDRR